MKKKKKHDKKINKSIVRATLWQPWMRGGSERDPSAALQADHYHSAPWHHDRAPGTRVLQRSKFTADQFYGATAGRHTGRFYRLSRTVESDGGQTFIWPYWDILEFQCRVILRTTTETPYSAQLGRGEFTLCPGGRGQRVWLPANDQMCLFLPKTRDWRLKMVPKPTWTSWRVTSTLFFIFFTFSANIFC